MAQWTVKVAMITLFGEFQLIAKYIITMVVYHLVNMIGYAQLEQKYGKLHQVDNK